MAIAGDRFDGMAKCVPIIQNGAKSGLFPLVALDHIEIDQHAGRLPKSPHHVLRGWQVKANLTADAAVDLSEQSGWNLDKSQPAAIGGRHETSQIADHAAANRDNY